PDTSPVPRPGVRSARVRTDYEMCLLRLPARQGLLPHEPRREEERPPQGTGGAAGPEGGPRGPGGGAPGSACLWGGAHGAPQTVPKARDRPQTFQRGSKEVGDTVHSERVPVRRLCPHLVGG